MSKHNEAKVRICKKCGARAKLTAKEIKDHAQKCRSVKKAA